MNRKSMVILVAGAMAMLSGCLMFYTGSEEGPFNVVAERDEPGRPKEVILRTAGRANWYVVFGPDGGGKDTYFRATRNRGCDSSPRHRPLDTRLSHRDDR